MKRNPRQGGESPDAYLRRLDRAAAMGDAYAAAELAHARRRMRPPRRAIVGEVLLLRPAPGLPPHDQRQVPAQLLVRARLLEGETWEAAANRAGARLYGAGFVVLPRREQLGRDSWRVWFGRVLSFQRPGEPPRDYGATLHPSVLVEIRRRRRR